MLKFSVYKWLGKYASGIQSKWHFYVVAGVWCGLRKLQKSSVNISWRHLYWNKTKVLPLCGIYKVTAGRRNHKPTLSVYTRNDGIDVSHLRDKSFNSLLLWSGGRKLLKKTFKRPVTQVLCIASIQQRNCFKFLILCSNTLFPPFCPWQFLRQWEAEM